MTGTEEEMKEPSPELDDIREKITRIDAELARLICRRLELARLAGEMKHTYGLPIRAVEVEKKNIENVKKTFKELGQDEAAGEAIWKELMKWSLDVQTEWF